jgi:hypothetical protein
MNFFMLLWLGLEFPIHGLLKRRGRRAKYWRGLLRIVERCWFLTVWSHFNTRLIFERRDYATLLYGRFSVSLLPLIVAFA